MFSNTILLIAAVLVGGLQPASFSPPAEPLTEVTADEQQQAQSQAERKPVDINSATAEQLEEVPGIGETLAKRIVEFRTEHGKFEIVDDLLNVRGIGAASLEKLRPYLTVKQDDG